MNPQQTELESVGRVWIRGALSQQGVALVRSRMADQTRPGVRISLDQVLKPFFGPDSDLTQRAQQLLPDARPVRIVSFNKTTDMNWSVPWHQDRVIAVREKCDVAGFQSWTKKPDYWHVEAPRAILESMLFARIHLDEESPETGGLELALGSHQAGIVTASRAEASAKNFECEACRAGPGDVIFIKALTLHRSAPSKTRVSRRTLRVDYCAEHLPSPLQWAI